MSLIKKRVKKKDDFNILLECDICGFKYYYCGAAKPPKNLVCQGCQKFVKRNPKLIKRNEK